MPEAVHQDVRQAREHLSRPQGRRSGLHPPQDQEEHQSGTDPARLHSLPDRAQGTAGRTTEAAGELWQEHQAVFTRADGRPIDPRDDWGEFKELLAEAGIADRRLYDGSRHTAGTILNELGVDMPTIMEILRHTQISQTRRYVKGRSHLSKDAMRRMGDAFLPAPEQAPRPATETRTETGDRRAARVRARRRIR